MTAKLFLLLGIVTSVDALKPQTCKFANGKPVAQPEQPSSSGPLLTCTPPHASGSGSVELAPTNSVAYRDAQIISYDKKANSSARGLVKVAVLALGADGGCARGACGHAPGNNSYCPPNDPGPPTTAAKGTARIVAYLEQAGKQGSDLVVLPENAFGRPGEKPNCFHAPESIEPGSGGVVDKVAALAKKHKMNVVLPVHETRASDGGRQYNSAVVINREGRVVGHYSKVMPVFGNTSQTVPPTQHGAGETVAPDNVTPSSQGVKVFDLDFGRIAVLICYDINFIELWTQAEALGADMIVWPSAMQTPDPSSYGYARLLQLDVVATGFPGDIVERSGARQPGISTPAGFPLLRTATVDIDRTFVHWDYNRAKVDKLMAEHKEIVLDVAGPPFWLLRSTSSTSSVRSLIKQYNIETNREYVQRSRQGLNAMRHTQVRKNAGVDIH